jgi:hypothetical protein
MCTSDDDPLREHIAVCSSKVRSLEEKTFIADALEPAENAKKSWRNERQV